MRRMENTVNATSVTNCPSFVDLKALAADCEPLPLDDPFGADARIVPVRAGDCEVFVTAVSAAEGRFVEDRGDTWIFVQEGALILSDGQGSLTVAQGSSAVVSRGTAFAWQVGGDTRIVGMRYLGGEGTQAGIVAIDNAAPLSPSNPPAADVLLSEVPSCRSGNQFVSADTVLKCGIWDSTPYTRLPIHFHHSELMHLLEGSVTFTDAAGVTATFGKGDTFIIERGADCSWDSRENVAKIYAYYRPLD